MQIGTYVLLRHRHAFRNGQPDLSESLGKVCESQVQDDGQVLISVIFEGHGILAPSAPAELFEVATVH